jgi:hypothetical protein
MVWAGISYDHRTELVVFPKGEHINSSTYKELLEKYATPMIKEFKLIFQ